MMAFFILYSIKTNSKPFGVIQRSLKGQIGSNMKIIKPVSCDISHDREFKAEFDTKYFFENGGLLVPDKV